MTAHTRLPSYRMAFAIADEAARSDIECECACTRIDGVDWYCTLPRATSGPDEHGFVTRALAYFALRDGLMLRHPTQSHFVRFPSTASTPPEPGTTEGPTP